MDKPYVGFWWRVLAYIIDAVIMSTIFLVIGLIIGVSMFGTNIDPATGAPQISAVAIIIQFAVPILYYGIMQGSPMQASVGKLAIGAVVTDMRGERMSWGKSFLREVCKIPSAIVLLIGFIMVAFTGRKQGLHDIMAGTLVLKRRIVRAAAHVQA